MWDFHERYARLFWSKMGGYNRAQHGVCAKRVFYDEEGRGEGEGKKSKSL